MLFEYVWQCPLASVVVCWHVMFPGDVWGCLGDVWGVSGGCLGGVWGISEWYLWKMKALGCAWEVCWCLSPYSMEQKHYLGTDQRDITFVT